MARTVRSASPGTPQKRYAPSASVVAAEACVDCCIPRGPSAHSCQASATRAPAIGAPVSASRTTPRSSPEPATGAAQAAAMIVRADGTARSRTAASPFRISIPRIGAATPSESSRACEKPMR